MNRFSVEWNPGNANLPRLHFYNEFFEPDLQNEDATYVTLDFGNNNSDPVFGVTVKLTGWVARPFAWLADWQTERWRRKFADWVRGGKA